MPKKKDKKTLVILDAHAILHRAYHALPEFTNSAGEHTGALYGLSAMLIKMIGDLKPDFMVACFDLPEPTFRKQVYEGYKAGRPQMEQTLSEQIDRSRDIFMALNIPIYEKPGFEADDVIGTIVKQTKKEKDLEIIIASGDMDTMQLVDGHRVTVYTMKKGISDTILYDEKAVKERFGFEPKLLPDYKGLRGDPSDNIIGIVGIGEKTATTIISNFGTLENLYKVLKKDEEKLVEVGIKPRMIELLKNGEEEALFSKTLAIIHEDVPIEFHLPKKTWTESFDFKKAEDLFNTLEFKSLVPRIRKLSDENIVEVSAEEKYKDIDQTLAEELKVAFWLLNSDRTTPKIEEVFSFTKTDDLEKALALLIKELDKNNLRKVFEEIEKPIIPIVAKMENRGILVDKEYAKELSVEYHKKSEKLEKEIWKMAGREFNINSPKQMGEVLFDEMKLTAKGLKKTAGGARSTRESELEKLKDEHPIISKILDYREVQKLLSTYVDNVPALLDKNNRVHTNLHQAGTTTGRMSSTNPNLQNIPAAEGVSEKIRRMFVATPGYIFCAADYSQIEIRVLALLSGDPSLIKILKEKKDVHAAVAALVFGVPENEVTRDQRRQAKVINFGIIYGMGVNALKANLGSTREEAQKFYDDYFKTFPTVKKYFDKVISDAYSKGYTETYFGRRRYFPGLKSKLPYIRASAERMAMNAPIQGTATGDLTKIAMQKVDEEIRKAGLEDSVFMLLQVHDELIFEIKEKVIDEVLSIIKKTMESALVSEVPLVVNVATGRHWGELEK